MNKYQKLKEAQKTITDERLNESINYLFLYCECTCNGDTVGTFNNNCAPKLSELLTSIGIAHEHLNIDGESVIKTRDIDFMEGQAIEWFGNVDLDLFYPEIKDMGKKDISYDNIKFTARYHYGEILTDSHYYTDPDGIEHSFNPYRYE